MAMANALLDLDFGERLLFRDDEWIVYLFVAVEGMGLWKIVVVIHLNIQFLFPQTTRNCAHACIELYTFHVGFFRRRNIALCCKEEKLRHIEQLYIYFFHISCRPTTITWRRHRFSSTPKFNSPRRYWFVL